MVCDQLNLIGKDMFAVDGRKMFSNVSKEWSGTYQEQMVDRQKPDAVQMMKKTKSSVHRAREFTANALLLQNRRLLTCRRWG